MLSSPAYADLVLELPAVTLAERIAAIVVAATTCDAAWFSARAGSPQLAWVAACAGALVLGAQIRHWTRSRLQARAMLRRRADGTLWLEPRGGTAVPVTLGPGTRVLGPSICLDLRPGTASRMRRVRQWLTPLDVPAATLRRWCVVLPRTGQATPS